MNNNPLLGQVLGGIFGQAMSRRGMRGGFGGMGGMGGGLGGAALGSVLGGVLAARRGAPVGRASGSSGRSALLLMLLPLAMRWVQSNGGMGAVLKRFQQQGLGRQAKSWIATGDNEAVDGQAVEQLVGHEELAQMAQRLGVPQQEVAQAFAEIMPELVNHLTPEGELPREADEVLDEGRQRLEKEIKDVEFREVNPS